MLRLHFSSLFVLLFATCAAGWMGHKVFWEQSLERMSPQQRSLYVLRGPSYASNASTADKSTGVRIGAAPALSTSDFVRVRTGISHSRSMKGEALAELQTDWSQIRLDFNREGRTFNEVAIKLDQAEQELRQTLDQNGLATAEIKVFERTITEETDRDYSKRLAAISRARANCKKQKLLDPNNNRKSGSPDPDNCGALDHASAEQAAKVFIGALAVYVTYEGTTEFDALLLDPNLPELTSAGSPNYWFNDQSAAIEPLKAAALSDVKDQARDAAGANSFNIKSVTYKTSLDGRKSYRFNVSKVRIQVDAKAFVQFGPALD